jgi:hypothetical protein
MTLEEELKQMVLPQKMTEMAFPASPIVPQSGEASWRIRRNNNEPGT